MSALSSSIALLSLTLAAAGARAEEPVPVLVELFTSEGCSSCPPADELLARLVREQPVPGARIIALGEHVDYWDGLGWKDAFSSPLFTKRQEGYVRRLGLAGAYTPQLVVGGRFQAVGGDESAARSAIARAARSPAGSVSLRIAPGAAEPALEVEASWRWGRAQVVLAVVEDRASTRVTRGENAGRTLAHVSPVRSVAILGEATGTFSGRVALAPQAPAPAHAVVFLQEPDAGRVYAAGTIALPGSSRAARAPAP